MIRSIVGVLLRLLYRMVKYLFINCCSGTSTSMWIDLSIEMDGNEKIFPALVEAVSRLRWPAPLPRSRDS